MRELTAALLARAARLRPARQWREVTLLLVDDAACAPINAAALSHDGATDVITMTYASIPGEPPGASAELVLNLERAWQIGGTPAGASAELALYLAHGCDHLCDFDDATAAARRGMRRRERRWLRDLSIPELFTARARPVRTPGGTRKPGAHGPRESKARRARDGSRVAPGSEA